MWPTALCPPEKEEELGILDILHPCVLVEGIDTPPEVTTMLDTIPESSIQGLSRPHWPSGAEPLTGPLKLWGVCISLERITTL